IIGSVSARPQRPVAIRTITFQKTGAEVRIVDLARVPQRWQAALAVAHQPAKDNERLTPDLSSSRDAEALSVLDILRVPVATAVHLYQSAFTFAPFHIAVLPHNRRYSATSRGESRLSTGLPFLSS